ncbi:hypothetical protein HMPREF1548_03454 [Clostridium sp. KLE 1755]|nr:hypothetical protein HMPREF1548_03454 [Clostridium sp. KLE 1755]
MTVNKSLYDRQETAGHLHEKLRNCANQHISRNYRRKTLLFVEY